MRGRFRGKRLLTTLLVVPITLGTVLTAQGLLNYLGPTGWFNRILLALRPRRRAGAADPQLLGRVLLAGHHRVPVRVPADAVATCRASTRPWSGPRRRSARTGRSGSGGSPCRCWRPGLATTFCLTFVLAFACSRRRVLVGNPAGETRVISIAAYQAAYEQYDYPYASAIAMIMGAGRAGRHRGGAGLAVAALHRLDGRQGLMARPTRDAARCGRSRGPAAWLVWGVGRLLLPQPARRRRRRCWSARSAQWFDTWLPDGYTTQWYARPGTSSRSPGHRRDPARSSVLVVVLSRAGRRARPRTSWPGASFPGKRLVLPAVPAADPDAADHLRHPAGDRALQVRPGRAH